MKSPKINLDFSKFSDADFDALARHIDESIIGNAYFTTPNPSNVVRTAATNKYTASLAVAEGLGRLHVAEKNAYRRSLEQLLKLTGLYVMNVADDDEVIMASSGFPPAKGKESVALGNPGNVTLRNGSTSGEMKASVRAVKGAKSYVYKIAEGTVTDKSSWTTNYSTSSKFVFDGLQPGVQYSVMVGAIGSKQQVTYSNANSLFAQ